MSVAVTRAAPEEWLEVKRVRLMALRDAPEAFASSYEREAAFDDAEWRRRVVESRWLLARAGADVVGLSALIGPDAETGPDGRHVVSMWVARSARGSGIGRLLIEENVAMARAEGARRVILWVVRGNTPAERLYAAAGFVPTGVEQPARHANGVEAQLHRHL